MDFLATPTPAGCLPPLMPPRRTAPPPFALAAVDIDDTLLGPDWRISAGNAAAQPTNPMWYLSTVDGTPMSFTSR